MKSWQEYYPKEPLPRIGYWIYNWFSNFTPCEVTIDGMTWPSTENYYQAMKSSNPFEWDRFTKMTPSTAKKEGRKLKVRDDWPEIKYSVMEKALLAKFSIPEWKDRLLKTGDDVLIEWNNWGDKIWGVDIYSFEGENLLGICLMSVRDELKTP